MNRSSLTRRRLIQGAATGLALTGTNSRALADAGSSHSSRQSTPVAPAIDALTIDLATEPRTLDPANVYDADGWSVIHSIYDPLVQYDASGQLVPLLAESLTLTEPQTYEITLRQSVTFHNGEPFDARSVTASVAHFVDPNTASQVAENFKVIERVEEVDPHRVRLHLSRPAPWLPAQMAAWLVMLSPAYLATAGVDLAANAVGTGPYRLTAWERGSEIRLELNPTYAIAAKGTPLAARVTYRFVPEATTRVADLLGGAAGLIRNVPVDQVATVRESGAAVIEQPISGSAWIRIPTDTPPFDDVRVRQALNHAVDVDAIIEALLGGAGARLANFFPEGGLGFDPALQPYRYDPDLARSLLAEAGQADGFETDLAYTTTEREDLVSAVAGFFEAIGVRANLKPEETASFNASWADTTAAPLRFSTWRPLFDPYSLLSLIVSNQGFLSRYDNPNAQSLIDAAAEQTDPVERDATYRRLGTVLHDEPAAVYLWTLTSRSGVSPALAVWTPRPDDYLLAMTNG